MLSPATTRADVLGGRKGIASGISHAPTVLLLGIAIMLRNVLTPWASMWVVCVAIFAGLKWLTWRKAKARVPHPGWKSIAYLLAWPGMDAERFLGRDRSASASTRRAWMAAVLKTAAGAALIWIVARRVPAKCELLRGWVGMIGLALLLHFGVFHLLALFWQRVGIDAAPIMNQPLRSTSLGEFWSSRWNLGFREFAHDLIFRPLQSYFGPGAAGFLVFGASGVIHELAISFPARGGYGFPTLYFLIQGIGIATERSALGKRLGVRRGFRGWLYAVTITAGPAFFLFHPWFIHRVIVPFLAAVEAI